LEQGIAADVIVPVTAAGHGIEAFEALGERRLPWAVSLRQTEAGRFHGRLEFVM